VNAYSDELMAIMAIQGNHTIHARERPRMSRSVSPIRYTLPFLSTTSLKLGDAVDIIVLRLLPVPLQPVGDIVADRTGISPGFVTAIPAVLAQLISEPSAATGRLLPPELPRRGAR
jgi:hypothetical protein